MEKKKGLFNFLTLGIAASVVILFIANILNFSLNIDLNFISKILGIFLLIAFLINLDSIKKFFFNLKNVRSFFMLSFLNLLLIFSFVLFYSIFRFGSPLIFEDRIANFKASQKKEIVLGERLRQSFTAKSNNLETIGLKIIVGNEDQDATAFEEAFNEDKEIDRQLSKGETDKIVFRIREDKPKLRDLTENFQSTISFFGIPIQKKSQDEGYIFEKEKPSNYFYENTYELTEDFQTSYFLFGFPLQEDSKDKSYVFEIEKVEEGETGKTFLLEKNSDGQFNFYPKYNYSLREIKSGSLQIIFNISRKMNQFLEEKTIQANLIIFFLLIEFVIFCFLKKEEKYFKEKINLYLKYGLLLGLFLTTIASLKFGFIEKINYLQNTINNLSNYNLPLVIFTVFFGLSLSFFNKEQIKDDLEEEKKKEELTEEERIEDFDSRFPIVNKISILRRPVRWCYKENWRYLIWLILIIIMFTAIKAPYFKISFTGEHTMKYSAYVEPAKYMYERNNPFWMQRKYQADPVDNPQGIFKTFGSPPIIEWGLFLTYKLFPSNSLEFNTRLFTHFLGILILAFAYVFFTKWLTKTQSLLIVFLMAISPIINFVSFVTVGDSLLLIFMFLSLIYLNSFIKSKSISNLFWAGLFFGIDITAKASLFLWLGPISFVLLAFYSKKLSIFLKDFLILISLSLIPIITFRASLRYLPTNIVLSTVGFVIWVIVFIAIYYLLKKYDKKLEDFFSFLVRRKIIFILGLIIAFFSGAAFLYFTRIYKLSNEFLTDSKLIFNWDMYKHMLNKQFKLYMTENVYYLGLIGFIFILFFGLKKQKILFLSFFLGSLIYWILASKVIFFHSYYTTIIMIAFCLSIGIMVYLIGKSLKNKFLFTALILLIILLVTPGSINTNVNRLRKEGDIESLKQSAQYLIENTKKDEIYIDDSYLLTLTILTNRPRIEESKLINNKIKESIEKVGFSSTMRKYNISYLVTTREPRYERYVNLFTDEQLERISYRRTDLILSKLDSSYNYFSDIQKRQELIETFNIKDKFVLEKKIGPYKFFKFVD